MKKILFFMLYRIDDETLNLTKFQYQMDAAKNMGFDVYYFGYTFKSIYLCHNDQKKLIMKSSALHKITKVNAFARIKLYKAYLKSILDLPIFDYYYVRSSLPTSGYVKMLKRMQKSQGKVIVEIPTYPPENEEKMDIRQWRRPIFKLLKHNLKKSAQYVDLYPLIGDNSDSYLSRPAINIQNGINANSVPLRIPRKNQGSIHVLCLASHCDKHGFDRLIDALNFYFENGGKEKVFIHLVGPDGDGSLEIWRKLTKKYNLEKYVLFEGPKYGANLDEIINACDIASSSLATYRININSVSVLKIREYTARGIPFIYTGNDDSLDKRLPYWHNLPNDASPINIQELIDFVYETHNIPNITGNMREYALENMSWETQFKKIFSYFEKSIVDNGE